jgi:probable HAF family extracellular repeat protein
MSVHVRGTASGRDVRRRYRVSTLIGLVMVALLLPGLWSAPAATRAAPSITMTDLGTLGGENSVAYDLNLYGRVTGYSETASGETHAFMWRRGHMTDIGSLGGGMSIGTAINDSGYVVGRSSTASGGIYAFVWRNSPMVSLGTLPGGNYSAAYDITNGERIVGESETGSGDIHAVMWYHGAKTDLGTLGGSWSVARAINRNRIIVGESETASGETHAFMWQDGVMTDLGTLGGGWSVAADINDSNQIVGSSRVSPGGVTHGFIWENGTLKDLGVVPPGQNEDGFVFASYAAGINSAGVIVGSADFEYKDTRAVTWQNGRIIDLGRIGQYSDAYGLNDVGQIVGASILGESGVTPSHALLWTIP